MNDDRVSPTAFYTGHVWVRAGLAPRSFATLPGRLLHAMMRGPVRLSARLSGGIHLDRMLIARHSIIDHQVMRAIERDGFTQVVELAAGLSPRGLRVRRRFPRVRYVEVDLPAMAARKRRMLRKVREDDGEHRIVAADVFREGVVRELIAREGSLQASTVFVTEGLINYFPLRRAKTLWRQIADAASTMPMARYLSEVYLAADIEGDSATEWFVHGLEWFTQGEISMDFETPDQVLRALVASGFSLAEITSLDDWRTTLALPPSSHRPIQRMLYAEPDAGG